MIYVRYCTRCRSGLTKTERYLDSTLVVPSGQTSLHDEPQSLQMVRDKFSKQTVFGNISLCPRRGTLLRQLMLSGRRLYKKESKQDRAGERKTVTADPSMIDGGGP